MIDVYKTLLDREANDRVQNEARIANDLQKEHPGMKRTEALTHAKRMLDAAARRKGRPL